MRKKVHEYIKDHKGTDLHAIARELHFDEKEVLRTILELQKDRLITFDVAVPLDQNNNDSLRYMATTKEYFERKTLDG